MPKTLLAIFVSFFMMSFTAHADPVAPKEGTQSKLEIKRYRYQRHGGHDFERLVFEFETSATGTKKPQVKVTSNPTAKNADIFIDNVQLVGAIPESAINETYGTKSKYLGNVTVNADNSTSFSVKTSMKESTTNVDAFWLQNPARLVIDVFPPSSPRAAGPKVLNTQTASTTTSEPRTVAQDDTFAPAPTKPTKWKKGRAPQGDFACFPSNAQVNATVTYQVSNGKLEMRRLDTDGNPTTPPTVTAIDGYVCFPRFTEVHAAVRFTPPTTPVATDDTYSHEQPTTPAPLNGAAPTTTDNTPTETNRSVSSTPPMTNGTSGLGNVPMMPEKKPADEKTSTPTNDVVGGSTKTSKSTSLLKPLK